MLTISSNGIALKKLNNKKKKKKLKKVVHRSHTCKFIGKLYNFKLPKSSTDDFFSQQVY